MTGWITLLVYLACAMLTLIIGARLRPDWYFEEGISRGKKGTQWHRVSDLGFVLASVGLFAWPIVVATLICAGVLDAVRRGVNTGNATRAELAAELAAARKEVDELLKKDAP